VKQWSETVVAFAVVTGHSPQGGDWATRDLLAGAEFGTFDVVFGSLAFEYSAKFYEGKQLAAEPGSMVEAATSE
jgi:hypothetical protein